MRTDAYENRIVFPCVPVQCMCIHFYVHIHGCLFRLICGVHVECFSMYNRITMGYECVNHAHFDILYGCFHFVNLKPLRGNTIKSTCLHCVWGTPWATQSIQVYVTCMMWPLLWGNFHHLCIWSHGRLTQAWSHGLDHGDLTQLFSQSQRSSPVMMGIEGKGQALWGYQQQVISLGCCDGSFG